MSESTESTESTATNTGAAPDGEGEEFIYLDPAEIIIGANVRTDLPDAKEFRKSIEERGVLEAVTVYRNEQGQYVCLRGQRRTVEAAAVGTPTGLIPCRVVPEPNEAERIGDQMVENLHRAAMREREVLAGVEQLALLGVSAAQITKRVSLPRAEVNAALAVADKQQTRSRVDSGDLTLEQAAIFAEFEGDEAATERLEQAMRWRRLEHEAQRLRDEAAERAAYDAEVERLRGEGLPVLTTEEIVEADEVLRISRLVTAEGDPVPEAEWPNVPGARVRVVTEWVYPDEEGSNAPDAVAEDEDESGEYAEPYETYVPVWVVTDLEASGLRKRWATPTGTGNAEPESDAEAEARAEAKRAERRRVIANNKAWTSAETVRREWLRGFITRKSAPRGAEAFICEAVLTGPAFVTKAMDANHPMLRTLLDIGADQPSWNSAAEVATIAAKPTTPKAATMTTLAAVLAAWEASTGKHTWRNPTEWDARVLTALMQWGYQPAEVERIVLGESGDDEGETPEPDEAEDTEPAADDGEPEEASPEAAA